MNGKRIHNLKNQIPITEKFWFYILTSLYTTCIMYYRFKSITPLITGGFCYRPPIQD